MCFGNDTKTGETISSKTIDPYLAGASKSNIDYLNNYRDTGFQEYGGPRVADLSGDENSAYGMIRSLAGTSDPYTSTLQNTYGNAATAGPQTVSTSRVIDDVPGSGAGGGGSTQDYMNPYIAQVLGPQLRELQRQAQLNQNSLDARATMGGAFGDARSGFEASENTKNLNNAVTDTTGKTMSDAYGNAMALKTGDINRLLDVDKTNAGLAETGMSRALAGGAALQGLDKWNTGRTADLATMLAQAGGAERGNQQSKLDAAYDEFNKGRQFPLDVSKVISASLSGSPLVQQGTADQTTYKPDNSGFGMLASLAGSLLL